MRPLIKDTLFRIFRLFPQRLDKRAVILMYHSVSNREDYFFPVSEENFSKQIEFLHKSGRSVISLNELEKRIQSGQALSGEVVITFDDGYRDNFTQAFPILKKYNFPFIIFVTTSLVGKSDKRNFEMLTDSDLKEMHASGLVDIEPHTMTHPKLSKLSSDEARKEILGSKVYLEKLLSKKCEYFAYPFGNYDATTVDVVRELGFKYAVTVKEGTEDVVGDVYQLKRNSIDTSTTWTQFLGKISSGVDRYESLKKILS